MSCELGERIETGHRTITGALVEVFHNKVSPSVSTFTMRPCTSPGMLFTLFDVVLVAFAVMFQLPGLSVGSDTRWYIYDDISALGKPLAAVLTVAVLSRLCWRLFGVQEECVTACRGIGLQISSSSLFGLRKESTFVDLNCIQALAIHEGFYRHQCIFYLCVVVDQREDVLVLFSNTVPRLAVARRILRGLRETLYHERADGLSLSEMEVKEVAAG